MEYGLREFMPQFSPLNTTGTITKRVYCNDMEHRKMKGRKKMHINIIDSFMSC